MTLLPCQSLRTVSRQWHRAPRRWGHRLHSLCSYMAMFPPAMPHVFVRWLTRAGDVVYDPFSGRGTTVLEACLAGRVGLGSDANPLAWILTAAKADPPTAASVARRLSELAASRQRRHRSTEVPPEIRMLFTRRVLEQLTWLQNDLSWSKKVDRYLVATLVGMLHGNANRDGRPRGLSVPMPNTFAMAPGYVRRYIQRHRLKPPEVDVLEALTRRLETFPPPGDDFQQGHAWRQNVRKSIRWPAHTEPAKLVFTSPPYLEVMKYGKFNWIRHWFLRSNPRAVDEHLFSSGSLDRYIAFITEAIDNIRPVLRDDGYCCLVVGDVRRPDREINLASAIAERCVDHTDLRVLGTIRDSLPVQHKVSRIWGRHRGRATRTDRILVLAGPKAKRLGSLSRVEWSPI